MGSEVHRLPATRHDSGRAESEGGETLPTPRNGGLEQRWSAPEEVDSLPVSTSDRGLFPPRPPLIVVGMHRSGTSLVARVLREAGVHMGDDPDIHAESEAFKAVNREILRELGGDWTRPEPVLESLRDMQICRDATEFAMQRWRKRRIGYGSLDSGPWGWKDPRTTLTLPVWLRVFPRARVLHVVRSGVDVALSLQKREFAHLLWGRGEARIRPPTLRRCFRLWECYVLAGSRAGSEASAYSEVRYDKLTSQPARTIQGVLEFVDVDVDEPTLGVLAGRPRPPREKRPLHERARVRLGLWTGALETDIFAGRAMSESGGTRGG